MYQNQNKADQADLLFLVDGLAGFYTNFLIIMYYLRTTQKIKLH